jgi:plasmid rolling circle replication initiator protein Rep
MLKAQGFEEHLSTISPSDSRFDSHKSAAAEISRLYGLATDGYEGFVSGKKPVWFKKYAVKIDKCGSWLVFKRDEDGLKLKDARFCKVPNCPMCQWRRSLKWRAKFLELLPEIQNQFTTHRWLFLTLTIRNCGIDDLRDTIKHLNAAFNRLSKLAKFPMVGYVKSVEVTRTWDCHDAFTGSYLGRHGTKWVYQYQNQNNTAIRIEPTDEVHPHLHIVGLVQPSYFGKKYVKHPEWVEMWKKSLRVEYDPMVNIQVVKCKKGQKIIPSSEEFSKDNTSDTNGMISAICETLKYTVKENDLLGEGFEDDGVNSIWLKKITEQLYKTRKVEYRGVLKDIGKQLEDAYNDDDLINVDDTQKETTKPLEELNFKWVNALSRYILVKPYKETCDD